VFPPRTKKRRTCHPIVHSLAPALLRPTSVGNFPPSMMTSRHTNNPSSSSSSSPRQYRPSRTLSLPSLPSLLPLSSPAHPSRRFHPYMMVKSHDHHPTPDRRRAHHLPPQPCHNDNGSGWTPSTAARYTYNVCNSPTFALRREKQGIDYFSALPQELIEQIGLYAAAIDPSSSGGPPFLLQRRRLAVLFALSMTSRQFHQIFNHLLFKDPLLIDSTHPYIPNTAWRWIANSPHVPQRSYAAKTFALWRPSPSASTANGNSPSHALNMTSLSCLLSDLANVRELTLSGNFAGKTAVGAGVGEYSRRRSGTRGPQTRTVTGDPDLDEIDGIPPPPVVIPEKSVMPSLRTLRLVDLDNAEMIPELFNPYRLQLTTLEIRPALTSISQTTYHPRAVIEQLSPFIALTLSHCTTLEDVTITLPPEQFDCNHCKHGIKVLSSLFAPVDRAQTRNPSIKKLRLSLPRFDCYSIPYLDPELSDDDDEEFEPIDHAYFFDLLGRVLLDFSSLETFEFTGPAVPPKIERKLRGLVPDIPSMTFHVAEHATGIFARNEQSREDSPWPETSPLPTLSWTPPPPPPTTNTAGFVEYGSSMMSISPPVWIPEPGGDLTTTFSPSVLPSFQAPPTSQAMTHPSTLWDVPSMFSGPTQGYGVGGSSEVFVFEESESMTQDWNEYIQYDPSAI